MEEEILYNRINDADYNANYVDGQVFQHLDANKIVDITKEGINENYYDIQRIQNGTKSAGNAMALDGATLSRYIDEELQADDDKVPSSQQAKAYMDELFSTYSPPIRGVDYWTEEDKQEIVDETAQSVIKPTGEYDDTKSYSKLDMVCYQGSSYIAIKNTTGNLPTDTEYWICFAKGGIDVSYDSTMKALNIAIQGRVSYNGLSKTLNFETV